MTVQILIGNTLDVLKSLPSESVHCCVTSPPYWGLRSYLPEGHEDKHLEIGLEPTPDAFVAKMVEVFQEVRRVLRSDGTLWLNLGDSYAAGGMGAGSGKQLTNRGTGVGGHMDKARKVPDGLKPKDLVGIPWRVALALQADGWYLRSDIIWHKCLSGGAIVYAQTQKGEMPMTVKDLVRLDPATVKLWDGEKRNQCLEWNKAEGDPERKAKSSRVRQARYRGAEDVAVEGDIEIELRSGERIGCTRDHRWPTQRGLVSAGDLEVGDIIATTRIPEPASPHRPAALDDEIVGWFVGLYIAEGSRHDGTINIASHRDETERFERLCRLAEAFDGTCAMHMLHGKSAAIILNGPMINGLIDTYVSGRVAQDKHLHVRCWQRSDIFLRAVVEGYLSGDGSNSNDDGRWKVGFCNNDALAIDLRTLCARIGASVRLRRHKHQFDGREFPGWLGTIYFDQLRRKRPDSEIVAIRQSRARCFWDIVLECDPHLFALASGVLTHNSNPMPESVTDRPTKSHEYVFLMSKSERYFYDAEAIKEPASYLGPNGAQQSPYAQGFGRRTKEEEAERRGRKAGNKSHKYVDQYEAEEGEQHRTKAGLMKVAETEWLSRNKRSVWTISTQPFREAHFATFPPELPELCIKAGCPVGGTVLDPFSGAGTTALVADRLQRNAIGIELNPEYAAMSERRLNGDRGGLLDLMEEGA